MVIEFIGTPGAGKTSLVPTVIEHLQQRGITAYTVLEAARPFAARTVPGAAVTYFAPAPVRRPLLWQVFYHLSNLYQIKFYVKHPRLMHQVVSSQARRAIPLEARWHAVYWFFHHVGRYEFLKSHARPDEALIFDEGFIHRVVQLNASGMEVPDSARVHTYVDLLPRPDLVVVPRAPREICEQRIYNRGVWARMQHKSRAEISQYIAQAHEVVDLAVDHIVSRRWAVIEVENGSNDLEGSKAELHRKLASIPIDSIHDQAQQVV